MTDRDLPHVPRKAPDEPTHWLVRAETIRRIWIGSLIGLILLVLLDLVVEKHPHFEIEGTFGFGAWYGFVSCVVLVFGSKALGALLKRRDTYYDD